MAEVDEIAAFISPTVPFTIVSVACHVDVLRIAGSFQNKQAETMVGKIIDCIYV